MTRWPMVISVQKSGKIWKRWFVFHDFIENWLFWLLFYTKLVCREDSLTVRAILQFARVQKFRLLGCSPVGINLSPTWMPSRVGGTCEWNNVVSTSENLSAWCLWLRAGPATDAGKRVAGMANGSLAIAIFLVSRVRCSAKDGIYWT